MPLLHSKGGLLLRAAKHGLAEAQNHWHNEQHHGPDPAQQHWAKFGIIIVTKSDSCLRAQAPPYTEVVTMDTSKMSPGHGTPGSVALLAEEASQSLFELKKLSERIGAMKTQFDDLPNHNHWPGEREKLQPVLAKLSRVQDETKNSVQLSTKLLQGHLEFCHRMKETLQHAAAEGDCHLSHDSAVVSAGAVVSERFVVLGEHVAMLQGMLRDVAQELRELGEQGKHAFQHPRAHHVWNKIRQVLPEILQVVMLVISWIGKILGLIHPGMNLIGEGAKAMSTYFGNHKHTTSGSQSSSKETKHTTANEHSHSDSDDVMKLLEDICDSTPEHIEKIQRELREVYSRIEQPMLKVEEWLEASGTRCIRMNPRDARAAADMWAELAARLDAIVRTYC